MKKEHGGSRPRLGRHDKAELGETRRFAIMARVSTPDQDQDRGKRGERFGRNRGKSAPPKRDAHASLDTQELICREYVKRLGGSVVKTYRVQESSLADVEDRAGLRQVLIDAKDKKIDALVVQDISRFASDMLNGLLAARDLNEAGAQLHTADVGLVDINTPTGIFTFGVLTGARGVHLKAHIAASIVRRTNIMRDEQRPAAGRPPHGRMWNDDLRRYVAVAAERARLQHAYDLVVRKGVSLNRAATMLKPEMAPSSLRKALRQSGTAEVVQHLGGVEYKFKCEPLLSTQQLREFERAIAKNMVIRPRTKGKYLLQGLVLCGGCGAIMTGQTSTKDGKQYSVYRHPPGHRYRPGCTWQVPVGLLDENILFACSLAISDGAHLKAAVEAAMVQSDSDDSTLRERLELLQSEVKQTDARLENTLDLLVASAKDGEARKRLESRARRDEQRLAELQSEVHELGRQLNLKAAKVETADEIAAKVRSLYWRGFGTTVLSFAQQREFVQTMVGRTDRTSEQGVYVNMRRATGGSKRDVMWHYRVQGKLLVAEKQLAPGQDGQSIRHEPLPKLHAAGRASAEQVRRLAGIAAASPGIELPARLAAMLRTPVQMRSKGAYRACT